MLTTDDWTDERLAYYLKQARLEVDLLHGEEAQTLVRPQHLVDVYTEWSKTRAENAALRDRLAAAEQREQQARAIIEPVASARVIGEPRGVFLATYPPDPHELRDQARAWLADRAEQRATEQKEVQ